MTIHSQPASRDGARRPLRSGLRSFSLASTLLAAAVALSGCSSQTGSSNTAHLKGAVTLDGEPIPADARSSITFKPTQSGQGKSTFASIVDGVYDSPDTPRGPVKVFVAIQQPTGKMVSEAGGTPYPEIRSLVPDSYTKGIELTIDGDNLEQNFDLK